MEVLADTDCLIECLAALYLAFQSVKSGLYCDERGRQLCRSLADACVNIKHSYATKEAHLEQQDVSF